MKITHIVSKRVINIRRVVYCYASYVPGIIYARRILDSVVNPYSC